MKLTIVNYCSRSLVLLVTLTNVGCDTDSWKGVTENSRWEASARRESANQQNKFESDSRNIEVDTVLENYESPVLLEDGSIDKKDLRIDDTVPEGLLSLFQTDGPIQHAMNLEALVSILEATFEFELNTSKVNRVSFGDYYYIGLDGTRNNIAWVSKPDQDYIRTIRAFALDLCSKRYSLESDSGFNGVRKLIMNVGNLPSSANISELMSHVFRASPAGDKYHSGADDYSKILGKISLENPNTNLKFLYVSMCIAVVTDKRTFLR
jgi:hypothetical protein